METKSERLKICDADDIAKVIKYEQNLGYNRRTNKQSGLKEYEVEYEIEVTTTETDTMCVEAYSEEDAINAVCESLKDDGADIWSFDVIGVTVNEEDEDEK